MKLKSIIPLAAVVIVAVVGYTILLVRNSKPDPVVSTNTAASDESPSTTVAEKKKLQPKSLAACLVKNDQIKQEDAQDPTALAIGQEVVGQLIDVPAGTNVDVPIATLDATHATGAAIYPKDYGTYNFAATKDSTHSSGWRVTTFVACKN